MNWEVINAVAEIVAAIAVVVSLLYLAIQIRQGTLASTTSVNQGIYQSFQSINELIAGSPDIAGIMVRGAASLESLSPEEAVRFDSIMTNFFNILEHWYRQLDTSGLLTPETGEDIARVLRTRLALPGVAEWWAANPDDFTQEFRRWVEDVRTAV